MIWLPKQVFRKTISIRSPTVLVGLRVLFGPYMVYNSAMTDPRRTVWDLCQVDLSAALRFARSIEDDWRRCQSLSGVAWHTKSLEKFKEVAAEALETARAMSEPYKTVACSVGLVRGMVARDDYDARPVVVELVMTIQGEPNPVSQGRALLRLFEAVYSKPSLRRLVLNPLLRACELMKSWRQPRILKDLALVVAIDDLPLAKKVVDMITKPSIKQQAIAAIEKGEGLGPHEFFPSYTKAST